MNDQHHPKCRLHGANPICLTLIPKPCNCPEDWPNVVFARAYPGISKSRLLPGNNNPREVAFAQQWMEENNPDVRRNLLATLLDKRPPGRMNCMFRPPEPSDRDKEVAATIMQWLGSNVGMSFISQAIERSPEARRYLRSELDRMPTP